MTSCLLNSSVGYTMSDIRYKWNDGLNSVQISADVSLPQFKVLGHRQKTIEASLSTGKHIFLLEEYLVPFTWQHSQFTNELNLQIKMWKNLNFELSKANKGRITKFTVPILSKMWAKPLILKKIISRQNRSQEIHNNIYR